MFDAKLFFPASVRTSQRTQPVPVINILQGARSYVYVGLHVKCHFYDCDQNRNISTNFKGKKKIPDTKYNGNPSRRNLPIHTWTSGVATFCSFLLRAWVGWGGDSTSKLIGPLSDVYLVFQGLMKWTNSIIFPRLLHCSVCGSRSFPTECLHFFFFLGFADRASQYNLSNWPT